MSQLASYACLLTVLSRDLMTKPNISGRAWHLSPLAMLCFNLKTEILKVGLAYEAYCHHPSSDLFSSSSFGRKGASRLMLTYCLSVTNTSFANATFAAHPCLSSLLSFVPCLAASLQNPEIF